jgi:hypothetical protein
MTDMTNKVIVGISKKLGEVLPAARVYTDKDVEQGLIEPCFFIECRSGSVDAGILGGRKVHNLYSVVYFPSDKGSRTEMNGVADLLKYELSEITLAGGRKMRGTDISCEVEQGVLHVFVSYNYGVIGQKDDVELFDSLSPPDIRIKGDSDG